MRDDRSLPPLLGVGDPEPVEVLAATSETPFVLTCEHAGRAIPRSLGTLGLDAADLDRHIAWDLGAADLTRRLARRLGAGAVLQRYSRLVVDCNRWPQAPDFVTTFSEDTAVPGNEHLGERSVAARERAIFAPYHDAIHDLLERRAAGETVLIAVHSFTPVFLGRSRPWHVGVLYDRDPRLAGRVLERLAADPAGLVVGDNEPYRLTQGKDYTVPFHAERRGLRHVEFEVRQDLLATARGREEWAARLAGVLVESV